MKKITRMTELFAKAVRRERNEKNLPPQSFINISFPLDVKLVPHINSQKMNQIRILITTDINNPHHRIFELRENVSNYILFKSRTGSKFYI